MKTLSIGLIVTATGMGGAAALLGTVNDRVKSIGSTVELLKGKQAAALRQMEHEWVWAGDGVKKYGREVDRIGARIERLTQHQNRLQMWGDMHARNRADLGSRVADVGAIWGMSRMLGAPVGAWVQQDDAINKLRTSLMRFDGEVDPVFGKLRAQIIELGNKLPGTTADYANLATSMTSLGIPAKNLLGGALDAAANLRVVLDMTSESAGETVVKMREAYNLTDAELAKTADITQRAKFAFGMKPEDLRVAASYESAQLNVLGLGGAENLKKMLVMQGMANLKGLEGSSFGTNFAMMMQRFATGPEMMAKANKGMKGEAKEIVDSLGITFDFFDKAGKFKGLDAMFAEFEKFNQIKAKYGEKGVSIVSNAMFGIEAARPAMILAEYGKSGFDAAMKRFNEQASLEQRISERLKTTKNTWEALTGSIANFGAAAAGPAVTALHPLINLLNDAAGKMTAFAEAHPKAAKWIGLTVAGVAALTMGFMSMGVALAVGRFALSGFMVFPGMLRGIGLLKNGLGIARVAMLGFGRAMLTGAGMAARAMLRLGVAMLTTPFGWFVLGAVAVAGVAYLIYRNWDKIGPWFGRIWAKVKSVTGQAIGWFASLPGQFMTFGANLIDGLIKGVTSKLQAAKNAIVGVGQSIKGWFTSTLGIHSPSRVFMGFGMNIGEGAALGILGSVPKVRQAVNKLSALKMSGALAAAAHAVSAPAAAAPAQQPFQIHYNPQITVQGGAGGQQTADAVSTAMTGNLREFERMLERVFADKMRRSLA